MAYTANGVYTLKDPDNGPAAVSVYVRGVSGGATVTLGVKMKSSNVVDLIDGTVAIPSDTSVYHGRTAELVATIAGATGTTDIEINYSGY